MGSPADGTSSDRGGPLLDHMLTEGWKFDFFKAVWLLERLCAGATPVGARGPASGEAIRFRPHIAVGFPPTDLRRVEARPGADDAETTYRLDVTFMGLYGVSTPLPLHYAVDMLRSVDPYPLAAEAAAEEAASDRLPSSVKVTDTNPTRDFLDIFHHRLISLFYRAWAKYRYDVTFPMPERDLITDYLLWLIGHSRASDEDLLGVCPIRMLRYAGVLTQHPRSSAMLEGVLTDYWDGLPVEVEQFRGRWVPLGDTDKNRIGLANCRLGVDLTVGDQVYDLSGAFNVAVGPVDWQTYLSFVPDGDSFARTQALVELYRADPLSFNVEVRLRAGQVPETGLSSDEAAGRLGYTSWVRTEEMPETSVVFDATRAAPGGGGAEAKEQPVRAEAVGWA